MLSSSQYKGHSLGGGVHIHHQISAAVRVCLDAALAVGAEAAPAQGHAERIGGTTDISAGQLLDRTGVLLGIPFPAGKHIDALSQQANRVELYRVKLNGLEFSLSGMENKVKAMHDQGIPQADIAAFVVETVSNVVLRTTDAAKKRYPGLPVLCSGGVASNSRLRAVLQDAFFAPPEYSRDNAMGIAVLARRALERGTHCGG